MATVRNPVSRTNQFRVSCSEFRDFLETLNTKLETTMIPIVGSQVGKVDRFLETYLRHVLQSHKRHLSIQYPINEGDYPGVESVGRDRVIRFFQERGLTKEIFSFDESTHDSKKAAEALGVRLDQIAKSILFMARGKPVLVVISGNKRVDLKALKVLLGERRVRFARETDVVEHTRFDVGAVSPVALPPGVRVLVDGSLKKSDRIYPAAGGRDCMFSTSYSELLELSCAEEVDVSMETFDTRERT